MCDLWMKEWRARTEEQRRKPKRGSDDDDGALRCKVLMGISAAPLKEQSRCMRGRASFQFCCSPSEEQ